MYYDLHMHSALSPCAENEMTPNNICNMAIIKGLELIAVTDHNSVKQLPAFSRCAEQTGIKALYGAEIQTAEEVHVLGLFKNVEDALKLQPWIDEHMPNIPNKIDFFGDQCQDYGYQRRYNGPDCSCKHKNTPIKICVEQKAT